MSSAYCRIVRSDENQPTWAVFRIAEGRARLTGVDIGHRNGQAAEVLGVSLKTLYNRLNSYAERPPSHGTTI